MKRLNSLPYVLSLIALVFGGIFLLWFFSDQRLLQQLLNADRSVFLWINQHHSFLCDGIMYGADTGFFWLPFYAMIALIILREFKRGSWKIFLPIFLLTLASDQVSKAIANSVKRLRPLQTPDLQPLIHLNSARPDGIYGFVSAQASHAFGLTVFLCLVLSTPYRSCKLLLLFWAILICYSQIYNGANYPMDVLSGGLIGAALGFLFYLFYKKLFFSQSPKETINSL